MYFLKENWGKIFSILVLFVFTVYALLQAGFLNYVGVYMSFGTSSQLGAVKDYVSDYFATFNPWYYTMLIPFILYVIYKCFIEKRIYRNYLGKEHNKFVKRFNRVHCVIVLVLLVLSGFLYKATLKLKFMQNEFQVEANDKLFKSPTNTNLAISQFGTSVFLGLDIKNTYFKSEEEITYEKQEVEVKVETDFTRYIDDTAWNNLNNNTTTTNYKTLNNYFLSREITDKNEYTGYFEGKNLIVIMMESVNEIFINPEYYPTFYKLYTEGWSFSNNYSPRNSCATGNNEMSGLTSLYTIYQTCTANTYKENEYFESMFNLFNRAGYVTSSYHDYTNGYYDRTTIHKNMGSGAYYGVDDLGISHLNVYDEWPSDILLMEEAMKRIDTTQPFMAWMTTVTSHQPYNVSSEFGDKYLDLFSDTDYSLEMKRYMSKLKEVDLALERLLELLDSKGVLDDTVIVLFGDHYPYAFSSEDVSVALPYDATLKHNVEKTPFVIYNSNLEGAVYSQYTSYMNILPTIANLFNLDYDPRLYFGEDILSNNYLNSYKNRVVFADGSWESDKAMYSATTGKITYFGEFRYTNEDVVSINQEITDMMKMSSLAIKTDYFKYLGDGLEEYKTLEIENGDDTE